MPRVAPMTWFRLRRHSRAISEMESGVFFLMSIESTRRRTRLCKAIGIRAKMRSNWYSSSEGKNHTRQKIVLRVFTISLNYESRFYILVMVTPGRDLAVGFDTSNIRALIIFSLSPLPRRGKFPLTLLSLPTLVIHSV
jgi:hypothetical protein